MTDQLERIGATLEDYLTSEEKTEEQIDQLVDYLTTLGPQPPSPTAEQQAAVAEGGQAITPGDMATIVMLDPGQPPHEAPPLPPAARAVEKEP